MKTVTFFLLVFGCSTSLAQTKIFLAGDVRDAVTFEPLAYATIGVKGRVEQAISDTGGKFELTISAGAYSDTLLITYVGYEKFEKVIARLASPERVLLKQNVTVLDEVTIARRRLDLRDVDRKSRLIRGNLYAMESEVTNLEYNEFLSWLSDYNQADLLKKCDFGLTGYAKSVRDFYQQYHKPSPERTRRKGGRETITNFNDYPAVNISHEGALEYCKWLTEQYNSNTKRKKFKKVLFRLPTLKEWQIAALGERKFQSWDLHENIVEVIITKDTNRMIDGPRTKMKYDDTMLYPWFKASYIRSRVYNQFGCYLGNFKITTDRHCPSRAPAYDGFTMTAFVGAYFPNDMGLYDVVGNVAEMIDEKGKACGGSWNDPPEKSTIQSVKRYDGPDETVGFRVFMEVIEK